MISSFELQIEDVFHFIDGTTVIVGPVSGGGPAITPVEAIIVIDGKVSETIALDGERMPGRLPAGHRAVYTDDRTSLSSEFVKAHRCRLLYVGENTDLMGNTA